MSLKEYKDTYDDLRRKMQLFCTNPNFSDFKKIVSNYRIKSLDEFGVWVQICILQYGKYWTLTSEEQLELQILEEEMHKEDLQKLIERAKINPRLIVLKKLWECFYASGLIEYLIPAYEMAGDQTITDALRNTAAETYSMVRRMYTDHMLHLLGTNKNHFTDHPISVAALEAGKPNPLISLDVFEYLDTLIKSRLAVVDDEKLLGEIREAVTKVEQSHRIVESPKHDRPEPPYQDQGKKAKESDTDRVERADKLFDKLASKLK